MMEQDLIEALQNPKTRDRAFMELVDQYQERLYWHIRKMVLYHEDANDVVQNTMIKVYRNIDRFKGESKLYTWLYRIATNETITFLNKKKKHSVMQSMEVGGTNLGERLEADVYFEGNEIQRKLLAAIETLPDKQRQVFNMRYFDEMSYSDMSSVLETSVGGLKASYHHAVKKIEQFLLKD